MAFLVKYIAFVVAFLSAAKLGEGVNLQLVDPTDAESIQAYADLVKQEICESFNPLNPAHMDAIGDDATALAHLLTVHYLGDNIEICTPKEGDRIVFTGTAILAIGAFAGKAAAGGAISAGSGWLVNSWLG